MYYYLIQRYNKTTGCQKTLKKVGLKTITLLNNIVFVCLFDLILYVPSTIFELNRDGVSRVELSLCAP